METKYAKEHKKLFFKTKYLSVELEEVEEKFQECKNMFFSEASISKDKFNSKKITLKGHIQELEQELGAIGNECRDKNLPKSFKKLYKKIMIKVHPDKLTQINDNDLKNKYKEVCTKAVSAADSKNWFLMVEAAMDLGIEINEINKEQVKWLKKDCKKIENNIITIKKSIPWVWFHSDNKVKKACMKQYIENYA